MINKADAGVGSLRWAMGQANSHQGPDSIHFAIGTGPQTIVLLSPLPTITDPVTIDATTQPHFAGHPLIELQGSKAGMFAPGFEINAPRCTIKGFVINGFSYAGIFIEGSSATGNVVLGNYLGTDLTGTVAKGNYEGIEIDNANNTVGGASAADRNVISGNHLHGIDISGAMASGNAVLGNYIGVDSSGARALGNRDTGINIIASAENTLGGTSVGAGNTICGNGFGVVITGSGASGNTVLGNLIGTNRSGASNLGNPSGGVLIGFGPADNTIGGTTAAARNVISGAQTDGINIDAANANVVLNNYIGTDPSGTHALPNADGVLINNGASHNVIGRPGAANLIALNFGGGVVVTDKTSIGNSIRGNSIHDNHKLGIDLGADGVTLNNSHGHIGPNDYQNFPVLSQAVSSGLVTSVSGTLNSVPLKSFVIDFYANPSADPSGYGQGKRYIGSRTFMTDASGNARFSTTLSIGGLAGQFISATATAPNGDTSEFCKDVVALPGPAETPATAEGLLARSLVGVQLPNPSFTEGIALPQPSGARDGATSLSADRLLKSPHPGPATASMKQTQLSKAVSAPMTLRPSRYAEDAFFETGGASVDDLLALNFRNPWPQSPIKFQLTIARY